MTLLITDATGTVGGMIRLPLPDVEPPVPALVGVPDRALRAEERTETTDAITGASTRIGQPSTPSPIQADHTIGASTRDPAGRHVDESRELLVGSSGHGGGTASIGRSLPTSP